MRVTLKFELDCTPDAAWAALRSPAVFQQVAAPLLSFDPAGATAFGTSWTEGPHPVIASALLGLIPVGEQVIDIAYSQLGSSERGTSRVVTDDGGPTSGALAIVSRWRHRMAVTESPSGRTLYRDRLDFAAGLLTPLVWAGLWLFWQWRGAQLRRLAPGFDRRFGGGSHGGTR